MKNLLMGVVGVVLSAFVALPTSANNSNASIKIQCFPAEKNLVNEYLITKRKELPKYSFVMNDGALMIFYQNEETEEWTMVLRNQHVECLGLTGVGGIIEIPPKSKPSN